MLLAPGRQGACDEPGEPVRIGYRAPGECPGEGVFWGELHARGPWLRRAQAGEAAHVLTIMVTKQHGRTIGELAVRNPDGTTFARIVSARTCEDVVAAVALIAAVSLPEPAARPASIAAASSPTTVPASAPAEAALAPVYAVRMAARDARPIVVSASALPPASRWRIAAALDAEAAAGIAPVPILGARAVLDVRRPHEGAFGLAFRLAFAAGARSSADLGVGNGAGAEFTWLTAGLAICPIGWKFHAALFPELCADAVAGVLESTGTRVPLSVTSTRPWVSNGLLARLRWQLSPRWSWELEGGAAFPWIRDRFYFAPDQTVHQVPLLVGLASSGLEVVFR